MDDMKDSRPWTPAELARLYQARLNSIPYPIVCQQLGRSSSACEAKWNDGTDWQQTMGFVNAIDRAVKNGDKEAIVKKLSDQIDTRLAQNRLRADVLADKIGEVLKPFNEVPPPMLWSPTKDGAKMNSSEDAGLMLSDLHIGQKHTLEETGGLGEYDLNKYHERLDNLRKGVRDIIELHSNLYRIPALNIFMLGDNTHGMNNVGKWSSAYIETSIVDQVMVGVHSLAETIYYFLSMFETVRIWAVGGNHGRASEKGTEKDYVNWDYITYQFLAKMFAFNPRVEIYAPKTWYIFTTIRNHKFLLMHGDDVKGGSFPIQSLARVEQKMAGILNDHPDYTMIGHFHSAAELTTNHGELFINGSFIGPDPYSLKSIQAGGRPTQKLFGIHDRRGVTWRYNIFLDGARED